MKNSKLNEIVGYPLYAQDVDPMALLNYFQEEGFTIEDVQINNIDCKYISHPLFYSSSASLLGIKITTAIFPEVKTNDYYVRLRECVELAGLMNC